MSKSVKSERNSKSYTEEEIGSIIDNLPPELFNAMKEQHIVLVSVAEAKKPLSRAIYDAKKEELIKQLRTQLNFIVPQSLKISNEEVETIKKDLIFYKKAYESEAANINEIIKSANALNNQLLLPLKAIKETINQYHEDFKKNANNITIPYDNKKEGIDGINKDTIKNNQELESDVNEVKNEMNSYQEQSINFFKGYSSINQEIKKDIDIFINSFKNLTDSVIQLKNSITDGFTNFENITPEFDDLDDKERIKRAMASIIFPLNKITELISESEKLIGAAKENQNKTKQNEGGLAKKMVTICEELKEKAKAISEKINQARLRANLSKIQVKEFNIEPPKVENIEENIGKIKEKIDETTEKNSKIKEKLKEKTEEFINQSRLDILFIIDSTNSQYSYLKSIKKNFNNMIEKIYNACPTATIYIGFIGYTDFSELDLGEPYIDIDFTNKKENIHDKISNLDPNGGGDDAEDLAGAFDLALKKTWKGFSRFAILATDAPCHGTEFHSPDIVDNYPDGDREHRDIKLLVKKLAENRISLFCAKITDQTNQMFDIFEKNYKEGKPKKSPPEFNVQSCEDICETIIQKACEIYKSRKD